MLGAVCVVGSVRGWRFPGQAPEPEQRLSRKAARHVHVEPTWSLDFLEPVVSRSVPDPIPFSGIEPAWTTFGAVPVRHAQRFGTETMERIGAELAFFTDDGRVLYERVPARWRNNPFPEVRGQLAPEVRRLPADETVEPIEVVARVDEEAAAYVHTADAARGGKQLLLAPAGYLVRLRIVDAPDEPYVWYRLDVPVIAGIELRGPVRRPGVGAGAEAAAAHRAEGRPEEAARLPSRLSDGPNGAPRAFRENRPRGRQVAGFDRRSSTPIRPAESHSFWGGES